MEADRRRIEEDLRGLIAGDVRCDDVFVQLYASDASVFEIPPLGVVRPRSVDDVAATVRYAAENGISLHARGAGSGLAGESLGPGLIVDFSRYLRRVTAVGEEDVTVQSGVVLEHLNQRLARVDRCFGPDPATSSVTTMGGVAAVDSSGSRWLAYGSARRHLLEVEAVLADGQLVRLSQHPAAPPAASGTGDPAQRLATGVADICRRFEEPLKTQPTKSLLDRSGYQIADVVDQGQVDLAKAIAGSEGTLALITQLRLATQPLPRHVGSVLFFFNSLRKAAEAAVELSSEPIRACDLMDRRHLSLARELDPRYELLIPQAAEAVLLVECEATSPERLRAQLQDLVRQVQTHRKLASDSHLALDPFDQELLWQLAGKYVPTLYRLRGSVRPTPYVEDIAIPPASLPLFLDNALGILRRRQITASIFGHAAHGQLHIRPLIDLANADDVANLHRLAGELYEQVWAVGGTISGEHGGGLSRRPFLRCQYGQLAEAFRQVKQLFDPQGVLNPGLKTPIDSEGPNLHLRRLTYPLLDQASPLDAANLGHDAADGRPGGMHFQWSPEEMAHTARMCNGCATCRTQSADTRMCPIFRFSPREEASPRAKANLVRGILSGSIPGQSAWNDACKEVADLCVHCHMCRLECPANVDVPKLMAEAKAQHIAANGQGMQDWLLARIDSLSAVAARFPRLVNALFRNRVARWAMERTLGVAQGRKLPTFNKRPFLSSSSQRRHNKLRREAGEKVLLFVDTYANYYDAQLVEAAIAVLEHNGASVYIPDGQRDSGMPLISQGLLGLARRTAELNVQLLAEAVRQGYTVVALEPSAALAISREYRHLLGEDSDAQIVADGVKEICHYLWRRHQQGLLQLDFKPLPMKFGYHAPCHVKALEVGTPSVNLLDLVPGLQIKQIEKGCSGIAGLYGFKRQNYRSSLRAGLPLLTEMRTGRFQVGVTECSTCRIQMEQGSAKPTIHPIKLLALSYGLMPELSELLHRPNDELTVR